MIFSTLLRWLRSAKSNRPLAKPASKPYKPRLESLEDRTVPTWTVNTLGNPATLVQSLTGGADSVGNISYVGAYTAAGTFYDTQNVVGINQGIVLSTGSAKAVAGPNNSPFLSTINNTSNDLDLDSILSPIQGF